MLLRTLGPAQSAEILSRLDPAEVAAVSQRFAQLNDLDDTNRDRVMAEFARLAMAVDPGPAPVRSRRAELPADPPPPADRAADDRTVREFDLSELERVPPRAVRAAHPARPHDPERFADLPVRCRAEFAAIDLPLAALADLAAGDVLLLGSDALPRVEFVGGEALRLVGRLTLHDDRMAVEIVGT
jgi:flagellar motor switch/type III secretory pathway protein FliN